MAFIAASALAALTTAGAPAGALPIPSFLGQLNVESTVGSTVPADGDVNPYGVVTVPYTTGSLVRGDSLVSNFNASSNLQGTGSTLVQVSPTGQLSLFSQITSLPGSCPGGVGLTTALTILNSGFVVVGSLPVSDHGNGTPMPGCLIVLNSSGTPVETWSGGNIDGPWDLTAVQAQGFAELFVTNVLDGPVNANTPVSDGTIVRIDVALPPGRNPVMLDSRVVGSGFSEQLNSAALVLGPTGVALGSNGTLYVADTVNSRIASIPFASIRDTPVTGGGITLTTGGSLNNPLGMALAPNGDVITVNGGDGDAVETTPQGVQIDTAQIDPSAGDLFGLTLTPDGRGILFVDDGNNTLKLLRHAGPF